MNFRADVAELVDAQVSEACDGDIVEVQVLSSAPEMLRRVPANRHSPFLIWSVLRDRRPTVREGQFRELPSLTVGLLTLNSNDAASIFRRPERQLR